MKYTIPNIISIVFISIYFLVDEIFVGQIFGVKALGAVGLVMPFVMIGFSIIDVVAMGSSVQISLHLGAKKRKVASGIFSFSLILSFLWRAFVWYLGFYLQGKFVML
nr:MATE family efflux transporter [Campylobacter iguaniorum]